MSDWFYRKNGLTHGPVSSSRLQKLARIGQIVPKDEVWREGLAQWLTAKNVKGLFDPSSEDTSDRPADSAVMTTPQRSHSQSAPGVRSDRMWHRLFALAIVGVITVCVALFWVLRYPEAGLGRWFWSITGAATSADQNGQSMQSGSNDEMHRTAPSGPNVSSTQQTTLASGTRNKRTDVLTVDALSLGATSENKAKTKTPTELFAAASPAVLRIIGKTADGQEKSEGSGFFITSDGIVITNYHVIDESDAVDVLLANNARFTVNGVLALSKDDDIAIMKVDATNVPKLSLYTGPPPAVGLTVCAIGNPQGLTNTLSMGVISGIREIDDGVPLLQTTAPISPGSSGGPLLNDQGEVLGLTTCYLVKGQNLNFAVPAERVSALRAKSKGIRPLSEALNRPKARALTVEPKAEPPDWALDLPYQARISFRVSADERIKPILEGFWRRELRKIDSVALSDEKPRWDLSVVALPQEGFDNSVTGYWMSIVMFEYTDHFDPQNPLLTATKGRLVKHAMIMRGTRVLEDGVKEAVADIEGTIIEENRKTYDALREMAKAWKSKRSPGKGGRE